MCCSRDTHRPLAPEKAGCLLVSAGGSQERIPEGGAHAVGSRFWVECVNNSPGIFPALLHPGNQERWRYLYPVQRPLHLEKRFVHQESAPGGF